jgi:hypothetical protein
MWKACGVQLYSVSSRRVAICKLKVSSCSESLKYQYLLILSDSPSPLLYREDAIVYREVGTSVRSQIPQIANPQIPGLIPQ